MTRKTLFMRRAGWGGALVLLALLGPAGAASAASYTVLNTGSSGTGSLRGVLALAAADSDPSDTITFDPSVTGTIALGGTELVIGKSVTITGPGADVLTLNAGNSSRVFDITSSTATVAISGLTIKNGNDGGNNGGGIYTAGTLTLTACAFTGNASTDFGGGLYNDFGGTLTVTGSTFSGNSAVIVGGGIANAGTLTVTGSTFSGNSSAQDGGGLFTEVGSTATITSCTFFGNSATGNGGALGEERGTLTVTASLFSGSTGGDITGSGGTVASGGSNLLGDGDGHGFVNGVNHDQTGVSTAAANIGALGFNGGHTQTCALLTGSPAIDADYSSTTATDQRGYVRPAGVRNDIGAYEFGASAPHVPATLVVTNNLDDGSAGSLRMVLAGAGPGDTVTFASSVTGTIALNGTELAISQDVTITGPGADVLAIDAGGTSRVFHITAGTVAISGLTIENGSATNGGGGLYNSGSLTVTACAFTNDSSDFGGGLYNNVGATLTVTGSAFSGDTASSYGGGLYNDYTATLTVTDSTFSGDISAYEGGGISNTGGTLTVTSSTFSGNSASAGGGGLYNDYGSTLTVTASLFVGSTGGDIFNGGNGTVASGGSNLLGDGDGNGFINGVSNDQTGVSAANAKIGALASNGGPTQTCALLTGSPAIDADYSSTTATDQRGYVRPVGARNDIGAYENGASAPVTVVSVTAASAWVAPGGTDQFTATATSSDGTMADVTATATWASSDTSKATVNGAGLATGVADGTTNITATVGGVASAPFSLTVHTPATLIVTNNRDDGSVGSLRAVLAGAGPGDTVTFAAGVTGTITLNGTELAISQDVTIVGPGADVLTINAGGLSRVFHLTGGNDAISGLTLANGNAGADIGGDIYSEDGVTLTLAADVVTGGMATDGGGLACKGPASVTGCTFSGNSAVNSGVAFGGGGIYNQNTLTVTSSTFSGNSADGGAGGGGLTSAGSAVVTSCTFSGNSATNSGGGGFFGSGGILNYAGSVTVTSSLFAGSTGGDIANGQASTTSGGSNLLGDADGNGFTGGVNHDQTGVANAMLGPLANNGGHTPTCAVLAGSPAIGGDYNGSTTADQRGVARTAPQYTIGAFEYVAPIPLIPTARTHVLWNNSDGRVMLWNLDAQGAVTQNIFGPYDDTQNVGVPGNTGVWQATALATGPDGLSHLLWNNPDGRVMLWTVDDAGNFTLAGYGPYTDDSVGTDPSVNKWHAVGVSVGADNVTHLLWDDTDGRMMLWNVDQSFNFTLAGFGPYTDDSVGTDPSINKWHATALATGPDNVSRIAWNNTDGRVMLWNMDSTFSFTLAGYGPYTDGAPQNKWSATGVSVGPDNLTHLLWGNTDRRAALWTVDGGYNFTLAGFGPYTDDSVGSDPSVNLWSARALATGSDNVSRLLWGNTDARMMLWDVDASFGFTYAGYGPYTDILAGGTLGGQWTATAVSAAP